MLTWGTTGLGRRRGGTVNFTFEFHDAARYLVHRVADDEFVAADQRDNRVGGRLHGFDEVRVHHNRLAI